MKKQELQQIHSRFFNLDASMPVNGSGIHQREKRHGILIWPSMQYGGFRGNLRQKFNY